MVHVEHIGIHLCRRSSIFFSLHIPDKVALWQKDRHEHRYLHVVMSDGKIVINISLFLYLLGNN